MNNPKVNVVVSGHRNEYHSTYKTYILRGGIPFADQVIMPDTKYVIKYDFDLGGGTFDLDFSNADTHTVAEVTYYYIPFIADGSKYTLMDDTLVFIDAEWNGLSAREIKPEKGTLFMIASITGGLHKNGYGINVVTVPENCILEFDGGSLDNGVIVGQDTVFINVGDVDIWGDNLTREGTWREHSGGGGSEEDKPYDPEAHSGLGRKTLQLKLDGSNILTQEDFDQENTIYVITYDFDLNDEIIEIPEGCILDFEGGSITSSEEGGKIIGKNTAIEAPITKIFDTSVEFDGRWAVDSVYTEWFGAVTDDDTINSTDAIEKAIEFSNHSYGKVIKFLQGIYYFDTIRLLSKVSLVGNGIGSTILQQREGQVGNGIYITTKDSCFGIEHLTLRGNNPDYSSGHNGIYVETVPNVGETQEDWGGMYLAWTEVKTPLKDVTYKYLYINDILVSNFYYGINTGSGVYCTFIENSHFVENAFCGAFLAMTDSTIDNCYCEKNGTYGLLVMGGNNKILNIKSIWNGRNDPVTGIAIAINCSRAQVLNCETQDNYSTGFSIEGNDNIILNCLSNGDGRASLFTDAEKREGVSSSGFSIRNVNNNNSFFGCRVSQYIANTFAYLKRPISFVQTSFNDLINIFDGISVTSINYNTGTKFHIFRDIKYAIDHSKPNSNVIGTFDIIDTDGDYPKFIHQESLSNYAIIDVSKYNLKNLDGATLYLSFKLNRTLEDGRLLAAQDTSGNVIWSLSSYNIEAGQTNKGLQLYFPETSSSMYPGNVLGDELVTLAIYREDEWLNCRCYYQQMDDKGEEYGGPEPEYLFTQTNSQIISDKDIAVLILTARLELNKIIITRQRITDTYLLPGAPIYKYRPNADLYICADAYEAPILNYGAKEDRPILSDAVKGFGYFDTTINQPITWSGYVRGWLDQNGRTPNINKGTTAQRRSMIAQETLAFTHNDSGFQYFDYELGQPLFLSVTDNGPSAEPRFTYAWVDAMGQIVT